MGRYRRQLALDVINESEQKVLGNKSAAVIGVGGLGSTVANSLARFGIGKLIIIDDDEVNLRDLHRQFMYDEGDVGKLKVKVAAKKLKRINSSLEVRPVNKRLNSDNSNLIEGVDIILDGSDSIEARYLMNEISNKNDVPWVYGSCTGTRGMSFNIVPGETPCFKCLISNTPLSSDLEDPGEVGTLSTTVSTVALYEVTQAIKILLDKDYSKRLFFMDMWRNRFEFIDVDRNQDCDICGN